MTDHIRAITDALDAFEHGRMSFVQMEAAIRLHAMAAEQKRDRLTSPSQPTPVEGRESVVPSLVNWLTGQIAAGALHPDVVREARDLILAREMVGIRKYGTTLQTHNGRDSVEDAMQEVGDLLQYMRQAQLEGRNLDPVRRMLTVADALAFDNSHMSEEQLDAELRAAGIDPDEAGAKVKAHIETLMGGER